MKQQYKKFQFIKDKQINETTNTTIHLGKILGVATGKNYAS